jgi:hypothetical protein
MVGKALMVETRHAVSLLALVSILGLQLSLQHANPANGQVVTDGLISYWTFDEADIEGDTVKDVIGGQHATMQGAPRIVDGKVGNALEFDGVSDWLLVSDDINAVKIPTKEITLEAWVYPEHFIEWGGYLSCFQDNGEFEKGWTLGTNNQISFAVSTEGGNRDGDGELDYIKAGVFDVDQWYHVVGVYDGELMQLYVNGEMKVDFQGHFGDILYPPNAFLTIGIYKDDNEHFPHKGKLDEVRLYEKALSEAEVLQNYEAEGLLSVNPGGKLSLTWGEIKVSIP